jgi:hypothetical protein
MHNLTNPSNSVDLSNSSPSSFWQRIVNHQDLRDRTNLEKLLAGCEIIAALDRVDLLAA